jgi:hypothetical protein
LSDEGLPVRCLPPNPRRLKALANVLDAWWPRVRVLPVPVALTAKARAALIIAYVYQFHSELYQRWQFNPAFYSTLSDWSSKPWPVIDGKSSVWPPYFAALRLPETSESTPSADPVPQVVVRSTYPDPYSPDMFWVAPLLRIAMLTEQDITPVLIAISRGAI